MILGVSASIGPPGGEPHRRVDRSLSPSSSEWRPDFDPVEAGEVVLHAYVIYRSLEGTVEVQPVQFQN